MNPEQNQYPVDYLNQIAAQQKKPGVSNKLVMGLIAGVILVVIIAVLAISSGGSAGPTQKMQTLSARLVALQKTSSSAQKTIKSGNLRSINSNLTLYLTNTNRDIVEPLANNGVDVKKIDKNIETKEKGEDLTKKLEDARLNATFDRIYAREMTYQLETVAVLMKDIYNSTTSKSLKEFLSKTDGNLQPIKKQLSEFNAATG
jgi:predicted outer membrane protein